MAGMPHPFSQKNGMPAIPTLQYTFSLHRWHAKSFFLEFVMPDPVFKKAVILSPTLFLLGLPA